MSMAGDQEHLGGFVPPPNAPPPYTQVAGEVPPQGFAAPVHSAGSVPMAGQMPGQFPGQQPLPGQVQGQYPGQQPILGQVPDQYQGKQPMPGQVPGQYPGQQPVPGQVQGQYPGQQPVIVVQPNVIPVAVIQPPVGAHSMHMTCPQCKAQVNTTTSTSASTATWLACLCLCLIGCDCGCCFIPFCMDDLNRVEHHCPNCRAFLGKYEKHPI